MELLLKNVSKHVYLNGDEKTEFKKYWNLKQFDKNEYLLQKGQICHYDVFVLEGAFKGYFIHPETDKEEIIFFALSDWWATDIESFHHKKPSQLYIQAIKKSLVTMITKDHFDKLLINIPSLERYFRVILQSNASALNKRIYLRNAFTAKERYQEFVKQYPDIIKQVPLYLIASYLGMSAEMLSKIRSEKEL